MTDTAQGMDDFTAEQAAIEVVGRAIRRVMDERGWITTVDMARACRLSEALAASLISPSGSREVRALGRIAAAAGKPLEMLIGNAADDGREEMAADAEEAPTVDDRLRHVPPPPPPPPLPTPSLDQVELSAKRQAAIDVQRMGHHLRSTIRWAGYTLSDVRMRLGWGGSKLSQMLGGQTQLRLRDVLEVLYVIDVDPRAFFDQIYDRRPESSDRP